MPKNKLGMFEVCLQYGKRPPCKHWSYDWVGFKCHGYNKVMQKCTGYEPATCVVDYYTKLVGDQEN